MSPEKVPGVVLPYDVWHMVFLEVSGWVEFKLCCGRVWPTPKLVKMDIKPYNLILDQEDKDWDHYIQNRDRNLLSPVYLSWTRGLRCLCRDFDTILKPYAYQQMDLSHIRGTLYVTEGNTTEITDLKVTPFGIKERIQHLLTPCRRISRHTPDDSR